MLSSLVVSRWLERARLLTRNAGRARWQDACSRSASRVCNQAFAHRFRNLMPGSRIVRFLHTLAPRPTRLRMRWKLSPSARICPVANPSGISQLSPAGSLASRLRPPRLATWQQADGRPYGRGIVCWASAGLVGWRRRQHKTVTAARNTIRQRPTTPARKARCSPA